MTDNSGQSPTNELADEVAAIAEREVGVREDPPDSNRGARVYEYQQATWMDGSGWPYCAAFVCYCVREALKVAPQRTAWRRPQTAGAWDFERWAKQQGLDLLASPSDGDIDRGDILVFTFSHIGIATGSAKAGIVPTVEGNTNLAGSREGGGVYARTRQIKQIRSRIRIR